VRRLRAGLVTPSPGGLGSPSVPTTRDCLEWLDAARTKAGESLPDRGPSRAPFAPGSYGPGDRKAAMERREARASRQTRPRRKAWILRMRRLALHSLVLCEGERKAGVPRAAKNRGGEACALFFRSRSKPESKTR
jgi:hypothetical protein